VADFSVNHEQLLTKLKNGLPKRYKALPPRLDSSGYILQIEDRQEGIEIDLMVNKISEICNSSIILEYAKFDKRLEKIVHTLKAWNKSLNTNPQYRLNNFSLYLMLIAFMQKEKILPNLQASSRQ
jgi:DNA polymerase sigma